MLARYSVGQGGVQGQGVEGGGGHLSPPHVVFSLTHHQFGPELSVSLRVKEGRDILTKFSHLPEFGVQAICQLSKNVCNPVAVKSG